MPLDTYFFVLAYVLLGLGSGFIGGLLGIGGGVIIVPVLYVLFSITDIYPAQLSLLVALATSLSCIVFTSASAAIAQIRGGRVQWASALKLLPFLLLGGAVSGYIAPLLPIDLLRYMLAAFLGCVAVIMFVSWKPKPQRTLPGLIGCAPIGIGAGTVSGLAGIAGGNVIVPTLIYFNMPPHLAAATSSALGTPLAAVAALSYFLSAPAVSTAATDAASAHGNLYGYVDVWAFVCIVVGAICTAPIGVKFAQRVPAETLKKCFALLLTLVAARMLLSP